MTHYTSMAVFGSSVLVGSDAVPDPGVPRGVGAPDRKSSETSSHGIRFVFCCAWFSRAWVQHPIDFCWSGEIRASVRRWPPYHYIPCKLQCGGCPRAAPSVVPAATLPMALFR